VTGGGGTGGGIADGGGLPGGGGGIAGGGTPAFRPVPVRAGLFTLDPQGQMPGPPHPGGTPFAWWLAPLPWPFQPLVAEEPNRP
jgi:hypothetical protein